jgi:hypothetical protein
MLDNKNTLATIPYSRSAVFKAMLVNDVLERKTGRIELLDVEVKTGKDLLFFMYSGKLKEGSDLPGLLVLADKYDIQVNWCYVILCAEGLRILIRSRIRMVSFSVAGSRFVSRLLMRIQVLKAHYNSNFYPNK